MCKQKVLKSLLIGIVYCSFPGTAALASSVSYPIEAYVTVSPRALMVDGKDRHSKPKIKAKLNEPRRFTNDDSYAPMRGKPNNHGGNSFVDGTVVDSVLSNSGADRHFGTVDDIFDRQTGGVNSDRHSEFNPAKSSRSRNPTESQDYFRELHLSWDLDDNGKRDARSWLEFKQGKNYCKMPAPTAVPLPGGLFLLGSGLIGLAATPRRVRRLLASKADLR